MRNWGSVKNIWLRLISAFAKSQLLHPKTCQEDRWITLGLTGGQHYLVVVHTYQDEHDDTVTVRLISARHATKHKIAQYQG